MSRIARCLAGGALAIFAAITLAPATQAASTVVLDVPQLATAGSARSFEFVSFQFNLNLVPIGDPVSDYSANVLANDSENYTYEHAAASGSGRGGGYHPPRYVRGPGDTYSATYQNVISPPGKLDAFFHFSGADVAGVPLAVTVLDSGAYSLSLTADADGAHSSITPGTPLSNGLYTLEYQTDSLLGSQISFVRLSLYNPDTNGDGVVDISDLTMIAANWLHQGAPGIAGDSNHDGLVDISDVQAVAAHWLQTWPPVVNGSAVASVPEPSTFALLTVGTIGLVVARLRGRRHGLHL